MQSIESFFENFCPNRVHLYLVFSSRFNSTFIFRNLTLKKNPRNLIRIFHIRFSNTRSVEQHLESGFSIFTIVQIHVISYSFVLRHKFQRYTSRWILGLWLLVENTICIDNNWTSSSIGVINKLAGIIIS